MNITREIIDYLVTNGGFIVGQTIFQGVLPSTDANGVIVSHSGGVENDTLLQRLNVHFAAQADDYDTANDQLVAIHDLLSYQAGVTLASGYVFTILPVKLPGFITVTEQNKYIFSSSYVCNITRP